MAGKATVVWRTDFNRLPQIAAAMAGKADLIVAKVALDLQAQAVTRAPRKTGNLRASIQATRLGVAHWRIVVGAEYGLYVEMGTISSSAQPYMAPSVAAVRAGFIQAMKAVAK